MLKVLMLFLLLIAGVVLGPMLAGHQGYVLIQTDKWNIETSVTSLAIILTLTLLTILAFEWLLRSLLHTGAKTRGWLRGRKSHRARVQTNAALMKLAEGDHRQAEKMLSRHGEHAEQPVVNYLLAAEAAQQRSDTLRASQHLERAAELAGSDQLPVEITRVRIQLARNEDHAARGGIDRLLDVAPRHPEILRLAEQAYVRTGAWGDLLDILPAIQKAQVADEAHCQALQQQAWLGLMNQSMAERGSEGLTHWWQEQSRKTRRETALQVAMADHLIVCGDHETAQNIVLDGLKRTGDERLILLIPRLNAGNPEQLEKALRQQIKQQGTSALLLSTLGQLLMKQGEWQQASEAFRNALAQRPDAFDFAWLADTLDHLHKPQDAAEMRREGLMLTLKNNP